MINLRDLLQEMIEKGASDLHLTAGLPPMIRVDGEVLPTDREALTPEQTQALAYSVLNEEQQKAILAAAEKAEAYFTEEIKKGDQIMVDTFKKANVEVVEMSKADYDAWLAIAKESSYKNFAEKVEGGDALIQKALAVE